MEQTKDMIGNRYGKLVVTNIVYDGNRNKCECICDCGNTVFVYPYKLRSGKKQSCGCDYVSPRRKSIVGIRYGKLVVEEMIYEKDKDGNSVSMCKCLCDCGNEITTRRNALVRGEKISCGCDTKQRRMIHRNEDLTGKRFGMLTVTEMLYKDKDHKHTRCRCVCDCGNETIVLPYRLKNGHTKSCGCYKKIASSESSLKDYTGIITEYGVEFIRRAEKSCDGSYLWEFKCGFCGKHFIARPSNVLKGFTKSCGCARRSFGESFIKKCLESLDINFKTEYSFSDCKNENVLRFDFAIFDKSEKPLFLIEYDGKQHHAPILFFGGEDGFNDLKKRDNIKEDYCKKNNIELLRIPYYLSTEEIEEEIVNIVYKYHLSVTTTGHAWQHVC